ncbi:MAG TPA: FAD-dependent oxidoreductase, partial [Clostridia bacterium]|nr:FAD-dependent oxidoreductase [Clostridia bacterium]
MWDVLVVGGGVSGVCAAVASARNGAKTLLVERYGFCGGTLTNAGVGPMMTFHAGARQVVGGLAQEIVDRLMARGASPGHVEDTTGYCATVTPFDAEQLKQVHDEMLAESGCRVLYHTWLAGARVEGGALQSVSVCNKAGLGELSASVYVDATGDADLCAY